MSGPFETEAQARALPAVQAVYRSFERDPGPGKMAPHTRRLLGRALEAAAVDMGRHDDRIAEWLSQWEPQTVAVIAEWVTRANAAGKAAADAALTSNQTTTVADALEVAAEYRRYRASLTCEACAASPTEVCPDHEADLDRADEYGALARQITEAEGGRNTAHLMACEAAIAAVDRQRQEATR